MSRLCRPTAAPHASTGCADSSARGGGEIAITERATGARRAWRSARRAAGGVGTSAWCLSTAMRHAGRGSADSSAYPGSV